MLCLSVLSLVLVLVSGEDIQSRGWRPILPSVGGNYDSRHHPPPLEKTALVDGYRFEKPYEKPYEQPFEQAFEQPFEQPSFDFGGPQLDQYHQNEEGDQCTLYKVKFNQQLYFQYIQYKIGIPDMKEFTLCMWSKFNNHSNHHPLFSYAVPTQPRAIYSWISNTERASYFSISVEGHTFYRLNYPLRLNRWYHSCQSWNSRTGEWQIWVNAERVGRGFHNRLVGHIIPGDGIAITGQEQRQFGGGFLEGEHGPPGSGGFLGEITMLQLYAAALAPGKAHRDHKHHHGQHNHHQTTTAPAAPTTPAPPPGFLVGNQIPAQLILNLGNLQGQNLQPAPQAPTPSPTLHPLNLLNAQNQLIGLNQNPNLLGQNLPPNLLGQNLQNLQPFQSLPQSIPNRPLSTINLNSISFGNSGFGRPRPGLKPTGQDGDLIQQTFHGNGNFGFNDGGFNYIGGRGQRIFKRQETAKNITKRSTDEELEAEIIKESDDTEKRQAKRGIFLQTPEFSSLGGFGGHLQPTRLVDADEQNALLFGQPAPQALKAEGGEGSYPREPAEGEVTMIMNTCSGCAFEPYKKAEIISWRNTPKKLYSGALYIPARPVCRRF